MLNLVLLALALSWDSFVVGLLDGSLRFSGVSRPRMAFLFAMCDGSGIGIGLLLHYYPPSDLARISEVLSFASLLLLILLIEQRFTDSGHGIVKGLVYLLPIMLSIDNISAASAYASTGVSPALSVAITATSSGLLFSIGAAVGRSATECAANLIFSGNESPIPSVGDANAPKCYDPPL